MALDRDRIVEAALALVDGEGVEALTMRRLAAQLDAAPMSLYRHVRDKDELLGLVIEAMAERLALPRVTGAWDERVQQVMGSIRGLLRDHPGMVAYLRSQAVFTPSVLAAVELVLAALREAGLDDGDAAAAFTALWTFTLGSVLIDQSDTAGGPAQSEAERQELVRTAGARAVHDFPRVVAAAEHWLRLDADAAFAAGLGLLLRGIAGRRVDLGGETFDA